MSLKLIVVGDSNSSGGVVLTGSPIDTIMGKPIARLGDLVDCPARYPNKRPHGVNPIVEGDGSYTIEGIPIALHGYKSACGCTLIGSVASTQAPQKPVRATEQSLQEWVEVPMETHESEFNQFFEIKDAKTDQPLAHIAYRITLADGLFAEGKTDENGHTERVFSKDQQIANIEAPYYGDNTSTTHAANGHETCSC